MDVGYAWVTARVIGPDGAPRAGRVIFQPLYDAWTGALGDDRAVVTGWSSASLDDFGRLFSDRGAGIRVAAPAVLPDGVHNYLVTLESPRDPGSPRQYRDRILAGTSVDLSDILMGRPVEDLSSPGTRSPENGLIEATNPKDVVEIDGGLLTWRNDG